jgi:hypothetical protein
MHATAAGTSTTPLASSNASAFSSLTAVTRPSRAAHSHPSHAPPAPREASPVLLTMVVVVLARRRL